LDDFYILLQQHKRYRFQPLKNQIGKSETVNFLYPQWLVDLMLETSTAGQGYIET